MGQLHIKNTIFVMLLHHLLKENGACVSRTHIAACLVTVLEHNSWFPDEQSLDLDTWRRIKQNVQKAFTQGECTPVDFWPIRVLVRAIFEPLQKSETKTNSIFVVLLRLSYMNMS